MEPYIGYDMGGSPSGISPHSEGNSVESSLKKGPWTKEEDDLLEAYVKTHGPSNWNAVQSLTGLLRCGKSCRLRWTNHLQPNLKKGAFSQEEERLVVQLHAEMGNKWAKMATKLPGRTDNEIKNFWNTRAKRLQKAGMSVYPDDLHIDRQRESQQSPEPGTLADNHQSSPCFTMPAEIDIPDFQLLVPVNPEVFIRPPPLSNTPMPSILQQCRGPFDFRSIFCRNNDLQEFDMTSGSFVSQSNRNALEEQQQHHHHHAYMLPPSPKFCSRAADVTPLYSYPGSHPLIHNGNLLTCAPDFGPEFPSIQSSVSDLSLCNASYTFFDSVQPPETGPDQLQSTQLNNQDASHIVENGHQEENTITDFDFLQSVLLDQESGESAPSDICMFSDLLTANSGNDPLHADSGNDLFHADSANDLLHTHSENDLLHADSENDPFFTDFDIVGI